MRRRLRKQLGVLAVLAAFFGGVGTLLFAMVYEPPPPPPSPPPTYQALAVKSAALFRTSAEQVDLLAIVQNPNGDAGVRAVDYTFEIRSAGVVVAQVPGETFFLPGQEKPMVALAVASPPEGSAVSLRFGTPDWVAVRPGFRGPSFLTVSRTVRILDGAAPTYQVKGILANESDLDYLTVDLTAYGVDEQGAIIGVGRTVLGSLLSRERREYTVSWPLPPGRVVSTVRVSPAVNVFSPRAVQPRTGISRPELPATPAGRPR